MRIILDTNFLLLPFQHNLDIFTAVENLCDKKYELVVLEGTLKEIEKIIAEQSGINSKSARIALQLIKSKHLKIIPQILSSVDDELVRLAGKDNIIATQDKELKRRIKKKGASVITMREKGYVELI